jgi:uncharacterized protein (AIM24 family)
MDANDGIDEIDKIESAINMYANISQNHKIKGTEGFQFLVIKLQKNEVILGNQNIVYIKGNYDVQNINGSIFRQFKGIDDDGCTIAFNSLYANTITKLSLYKDEVYNITKHCIIAYTDNVISEKNITNDNLLKIKTNDDKAYIWLSAYGDIDKLELKDEEKILINAGTFLYSTQDIILDLNKNYILKGPSTITIQTKNILKYILENQNKLPTPAQPVTQPAVQPVTQPAVQPVTQPAVQPVTQPVIQPIPLPVEKNIDNSEKKGFFNRFFSGGGKINDKWDNEDIELNTSIRKMLREI